jgi:hypothetical protein
MFEKMTSVGVQFSLRGELGWRAISKLPPISPRGLYEPHNRQLTVLGVSKIFTPVPQSPASTLALSMLRNGASRLALSTIRAPAARPSASFQNITPTFQWQTQYSSVASKRPQLLVRNQLKPIQVAIARRTITDKQKQAESRYSKEELKPSPETVTASSSTHAMFGEVGVDIGVENKDNERGVDVTAGLKHDVVGA